MDTQTINNASNLCEDPDTKGFDLEAGQSWVYPTNYPVRDYQYNIIQEALHKNTLVSLPTGLGKTFIAAVVMYNFFRWYPHGKIIFMAPTRPLVEQQIDACYRIMAIPHEATAELTGAKKSQVDRVEVWQNKRVFFATPHVLQNDLESVIELGEKIKCLVFDEAHKAKGNYAYCEVIRKLLLKTKLFRVLALSATPGNSVKDVAEVMRNLMIAHLEFRSEESPDVKPYVFERSLETIVVPLGTKIQQIKENYEKILEKYVRILVKNKVITTNVANLTKGKIFMVLQDVKTKRNCYPNYGEITKTLNICITLYHAYEGLVRCGLRHFLSFFEEHISNPLINGNCEILDIMEDVRKYLGPAPNVEILPDGNFTEIPASVKFGHPKFYQLRDILLAHFATSEASSRVIVFFEFRESVKEAYAILSQNRPAIRPRIFVGQGVGQRQKDQIQTVKSFREGSCNTLLSTCIGEEGLDVGEVNLIVCFDITNKSPIRMIQRMGRTGRKKEGRIIVLVTEGKEQQTLKDCLVYKNNLGASMMNSQQLNDVKYRDNPIMIPSYIHPKCQKLYITVTKKPTVPSRKNGNLKEMLRGLSNDNLKFLDDCEVVEIQEKLTYKSQLYWNKVNPLSLDYESPKIDFSKHLEKQRSFQAFGEIKSSKQSQILVTLLQSADSKRYNIPETQTISRFKNFSEGQNLVQGDIRSMFSKAAEDLNAPLSQIYILEKEKDITNFPEELFQEIANFLSITTSVGHTCKICENLFECPKFYYQKAEPIDLSTWAQPDLSVLENITAKNLDIFADSLRPESRELYKSLEADDEVFSNLQFTQFEEIDDEPSKSEEKSFAYKTPKGFEKLMKSYKICEGVVENQPKIIEEKSLLPFETPKSFGKIFKNHDSEKSENILDFFKLTSIEDLFVDETVDLDETLIYTPEIKQDTSPMTPDLFEQSPDLFPSSSGKTKMIIEDPKTPEHEETPFIDNSESPVICTFEKVQRMKAKKRLFEQSTDDNTKKPNLAILKTPHKCFFETNRTPKEIPAISSTKSVTPKCSPKEIRLGTPSHSPNLDISDICDLSEFGLDKVNPSQEKKDVVVNVSDLEISDICDLSIFGLTKTQIAHNTNQIEDNTAEPVKKAPNEDLKLDDVCDMSTFCEEPVLKNNDDVIQTSDASPKKDLNVNDVDWSSFFDEPVVSKNEPTVSKSQTEENAGRGKKNEDYKKNKTSELSEFCEFSSLLSPVKNTPRKTTVIDLTDSDFESSPEKTKPTQRANKTRTQLSITQVLSLVNKDNKKNSQKENYVTPRKATKKPVMSFKNKDDLQTKQKASSSKTRQVTHKVKSKFNLSLASNSDDEFETSPTFAKPKPLKTTASTKKPKMKKPSTKQKRRKKLFRDYLDEEAVLSEDERVVVSEDEDSGEDCFEASFVNDETQAMNTTMKVAYLKSIKSPPTRGRFKIPEKPRNNVSYIFSQEVDAADDTYMNDSFVVNTEDMMDSPKAQDLSELEILEMKLEKMKKKKKRKSDDKKLGGKDKRRRIVVISDDDSD